MQWFQEAADKKERETLSKVGKVVGGNNGRIRDMVLHMHEKRIQDFDSRLAAPELKAADSALIENEKMEYMLGCGGVVARFSSTSDNDERRNLSITYLEQIGDSLGASLVREQWAEAAVHATNDDSDEDENWPQRLISTKHGTEVCNSCGAEDEFLDEGCELVCTKCGSTSLATPKISPAQIASNGMQITTKYSYNRASHFRDRILQWLGTEFRGDLSQDVIDRLLLQLRKERVTSVDGWSKKRMVSLLKRAGLNEYYEHSHHLYV